MINVFDNLEGMKQQILAILLTTQQRQVEAGILLGNVNVCNKELVNLKKNLEEKLEENNGNTSTIERLKSVNDVKDQTILDLNKQLDNLKGEIEQTQNRNTELGTELAATKLQATLMATTNQQSNLELTAKLTELQKAIDESASLNAQHKEDINTKNAEINKLKASLKFHEDRLGLLKDVIVEVATTVLGAINTDNSKKILETLETVSTTAEINQAKNDLIKEIKDVFERHKSLNADQVKKIYDQDILLARNNKDLAEVRASLDKTKRLKEVCDSAFDLKNRNFTTQVASLNKECNAHIKEEQLKFQNLLKASAATKSELETTIVTGKQKNAELTSQIKDLESELETQKKNHDILQVELENKTQKFFSEKIKEFDDKQDEKEAEISKLNKDITSLDSELKQQKTTNEELLTTKTQLSQESEKSTKHISELTSQIKDLESDLETQRNQMSANSNLLQAEKNVVISNLNNDIANLTSALEQQKTLNDEYQKNYNKSSAALDEELAKKTKVIETLQAKLDDLNSQLSDRQKTAAAYKQETDEQISDLKSAQETLNIQHATSLREMEETNKKLNGSLERQTKLTAILQEQIDILHALETDYESANETLSALEELKTGTNLKEKIDKLINLKNSQKTELELARQTIQTLNTANAQLNTDIEKLNREITDLRETLSAVKQPEVIALIDNCPEDEAKILALEKTLKNKLATLNKIQTTLKDMESLPTGLLIKFCGSDDCLTTGGVTGGVEGFYNDQQTSLTSFLSSAKNCATKRQYLSENVGLFAKNDLELSNLNEDVLKAVRVFVKVKPTPTDATSTIDVEGNSLTLTNCGEPNKTFGEFSGVFNSEEPGNAQVYKGLKASIDQVASGYSIVIFGYGLSGSGKTYTLLGDKTSGVEGILQLGLNHLETSHNSAVTLAYIFEQYVHDFNPGTNNVNGEIINYSSTTDVPPLLGFRTTRSSPITTLNNTIIDTYNKDKNKHLETLLSSIDALRKEAGRIKATAFNEASSRSNLFMVFKVVTNGVTGYLTIVDTAGREDPIELYAKYMSDHKTGNNLNLSIKQQREKIPGLLTSLLTNECADKDIYADIAYRNDIVAYDNRGTSAAVINKKKPTRAKRQCVYLDTIDWEKTQPTIKDEVILPTNPYYQIVVNNIIKEGMYINEALNHLRFYFKKDTDTEVIKNTLSNNYGVDKFFEPPKVMVAKKGGQNKDTSDDNDFKADARARKILMIPILKFLDTGLLTPKNGEYVKPTKFITIVCVQDDKSKCDEIIKSLNFAQSIKST